MPVEGKMYLHTIHSTNRSWLNKRIIASPLHDTLYQLGPRCEGYTVYPAESFNNALQPTSLQLLPCAFNLPGECISSHFEYFPLLCLYFPSSCLTFPPSKAVPSLMDMHWIFQVTIHVETKAPKSIFVKVYCMSPANPELTRLASSVVDKLEKWRREEEVSAISASWCLCILKGYF